jgi:hypothetical protein
MKAAFDIDALPIMQRLQMREHALNYRTERLLAWKACYSQVRRHAKWHSVLTPEAIAQAHTAHVVLDKVGHPMWSN